MEGNITYIDPPELSGSVTSPNLSKAASDRETKAFTFDHSYWSAGPKDDPNYASQQTLYEDLGKVGRVSRNIRCQPVLKTIYCAPGLVGPLVRGLQRLSICLYVHNLAVRISSRCSHSLLDGQTGSVGQSMSATSANAYQAGAANRTL